MKLRFVGSTPTAFMALGVYVEPGDEFEVQDDAAPAFLARADVINVTPDPSEDSAADQPEAEPAPATRRSRATTKSN